VSPLLLGALLLLLPQTPQKHCQIIRRTCHGPTTTSIILPTRLNLCPSRPMWKMPSPLRFTSVITLSYLYCSTDIADMQTLPCFLHSCITCVRAWAPHRPRCAISNNFNEHCYQQNGGGRMTVCATLGATEHSRIDFSLFLISHCFP
jgi:hypothetical protein